MTTRTYNYNKVVPIKGEADGTFPGLYYKVDSEEKTVYAIFTSITTGGIIEENPSKELTFDTPMNIEEWSPMYGRVLSTLITEFCEEKDSLAAAMRAK
jgi:hypothetical protein